MKTYSTIKKPLRFGGPVHLLFKHSCAPSAAVKKTSMSKTLVYSLQSVPLAMMMQICA